ncbi:MAG: ankyrin repeat domain-containing protein, partial [Verrucomicrobiota bacterium]
PRSAVEAAESGDLEILRNLQDAEVGLGQADEMGNTPLLAAVRSDNRESIDFLLTQDSVLASLDQATPVERDTPVGQALRRRDFDLADRFLGLGASIDVDEEPGLPFVIKATRQNDGEMLEYLFENDADVDYLGAQSAPALAVAAAKGDLGLMKRFIEAGASVDGRGESGKPLLIETTIDGRDDQFDLLLESGADIEASIDGGKGNRLTSLAFAMDRANPRMFDALLARGADTNVSGTGGGLLLHEAVAARRPDQADKLLSHGADPNQVSTESLSALSIAARNDDLNMVDLLVEKGADATIGHDSGVSPLQIAVDQGNVAVSYQLIAAGSKMDAPGLLTAAYQRRDDPLMHLLLNAGADPESIVPGTGQRVFDAAVNDGATNAVRTLLDAGAGIGDNLWAALLTGQDDLIRLILDAGADPRQPGPDGQDPLAYCLERERYKAARMLLDGGADPDARYDDQDTWLSRAIRLGNDEMATALVEAGATVKEVKMGDGHTLLGWAIANKMQGTALALIAAGVDPDQYERYPATNDFAEKFERSSKFRYHLKVDRRIRPIMMASVQGDHVIAQALADAGADHNAYTPKWLSAAIIASWYKDVRMQQIGLIGHSPKVQPRKLVVDLSSQRATLYEGGTAVYSTRVSTGKRGYRTPPGEYVISDKHRRHTSSIYGSSMPYFQRFSFSAFGTHVGNCPGYPASHGCIRAPYSGAKELFRRMEVGDYAVIVN